MTKSNTAVAAHRGDQLPMIAAQVDLEALSGAGIENATEKSFAIPFLRILQSGSPQVKRTDGAFIDGAVEGMLINTVTNEIIDTQKEGVSFIPSYFRQAYVEWIINEDGGGFVGEHPINTPLVAQIKRDDKNRDILPNGHQIVDTRFHYGLVVRGDGRAQPAVITMAGTQLKQSRKWMSVIGSIKLPRKPKVDDNGDEQANGFFNPPSFSHAYALGIQAESNDKGSWWGWKVGPATPLQDAFAFAEAQDLYTRIKSGQVKEATETLGPTGANSASDEPRF